MKSLECTCLNFVVQEKTLGVYLSWVVLEILVQSYAYEDFSSTFILGSLWKPGAMHVKTWGVCLYLWWSLKARCNAYKGVGSSSIVLESTVQCIGKIQKYALGYYEMLMQISQWKSQESVHLGRSLKAQKYDVGYSKMLANLPINNVHEIKEENLFRGLLFRKSSLWKCITDNLFKFSQFVKIKVSIFSQTWYE